MHEEVSKNEQASKSEGVSPARAGETARQLIRRDGVQNNAQAERASGTVLRAVECSSTTTTRGFPTQCGGYQAHTRDSENIELCTP
jgi:hypothetical protein